MANEKITLTLDDLNSPKVEGRLKQQEAVNAAQAKFHEQAPSKLDLAKRTRESTSLWSNTLFAMSLFGLLGGLLAWGCGELKYLFNPDYYKEARSLLAEMNELRGGLQAGSITLDQARGPLHDIEERGRNNPYFQISSRRDLTLEAQQAAIERQRSHDHLRDLIANVIYYGACGMMIALALAVADPISARNYRTAVTNGAVGAVLGLIGGVIVSLFADSLYHALGGGGMDEVSAPRQILANTVKWGVLGLFLSAAAGVVMKNRKKLIVGLIGGLTGGILGGALFVPVAQLTRGWHFAHEDTISRLVAMVAIGLVAGVGTGLIEAAAKAGWMKVTSGLIAGKQFILYRNPTFIGSAPQCQIYLFKDPKIGRRHAAIHIMPGGYYIEDLGSGAQTLVNNKPIARVRLRHGDQVQIGATTFAFREKEKVKQS